MSARNVVKSFAELGDLVNNAGKLVEMPAPTNSASAVITPTFPSLGNSSMEDPAKVAAFRGAVNAFVLQMKEWVKRLGVALASDEDTLAYQIESVLADEEKIATSIVAMSGHARKVMGVAYMDAMIEYFPPTEVGLNHIADQGTQIEFFRLLGEGEDKHYVSLPVTGENNELRYLKLTSSYLDATRILKALMAITAAARKAQAEAEHRQTRSFNAHTKLLLPALNSGNGETSCYLPPSDEGPALRVRIRIEKNTVTATAAMGDESVGELVGVKIPLESLKTNTFSDEVRKDTDAEQWRKMVSLRKFIRAAIRHEYNVVAIRRELENLRRLANTSVEDFDRGAIGVAVVTLERWSEHRWLEQPDGTFQKGPHVANHNNIPLAVERNGNREIRLVSSLKQHEGLFPPDCRTFTSEMSPDPALQKLAYGGLGILGVVLRGVHFNLERDKRKSASVGQN